MSLDGLFTPNSIAVYGASATDSRKLGNTLLANVASGAGEVLAVYPSADIIDGVPAVASLDRSADLALISVPGLKPLRRRPVQKPALYCLQDSVRPAPKDAPCKIALQG